jgi:hypothetical protein
MDYTDVFYEYLDCSLGEQGRMFNLGLTTTQPHRMSPFRSHTQSNPLPDSLSDDYWMTHLEGFYQSQRANINIAFDALQRQYSSGATANDWSLQSSPQGGVVKALSGTRGKMIGIPPNLMANIITGLQIDTRVLIGAEGQLCRVILAISSHRERTLAVMLWMIVIMRLGGVGFLEQPLRCRLLAATEFNKWKNCAGSRGMFGAYAERCVATAAFNDVWFDMVCSINKARNDFIGDICYDTGLCGTHPPGFDHNLLRTPESQPMTVGPPPHLEECDDSCTACSSSEEEESSDDDDDVEPLDLASIAKEHINGSGSSAQIHNGYGVHIRRDVHELDGCRRVF